MLTANTYLAAIEEALEPGDEMTLAGMLRPLKAEYGFILLDSSPGKAQLTFFRDLTARGPTGVQLVTSAALRGLVEALGATLPGAGWQRCRTHYAAN